MTEIFRLETVYKHITEGMSKMLRKYKKKTERVTSETQLGQYCKVDDTMNNTLYIYIICCIDKNQTADARATG